MKFSAKDRDKDLADYSCAETFGGGWWYYDCYFVNLNGVFYSYRGFNKFGLAKNFIIKTSRMMMKLSG